MIVKESIGFKRGIDPKDSLEIGDSKMREIIRNYETLGELISTMNMDTKESFGGINDTIDSTKKILDYIIADYLNKELGLNLKVIRTASYPGEFAIEDNQKYSITLYKSTTGNSISYEISSDGYSISSPSSSMNLKTLSNKLSNSLRKLGII